MKTIKIFLLTVIYCFVLFFLCEKNDNNTAPPPPPYVFKFKEGKDYSNKVYVKLNDEKTRIIAYPSYPDLKYDTVIDIYKSYYFGHGYTNGINTAYLDITVEEFKHADDTLDTKEEMWQLIIDKDPYAEFYVDENNYLLNHCPECLDKDTTWPNHDTAKFHRLVDNNELGKYLKRLK